jgi:hypothetical protein
MAESETTLVSLFVLVWEEIRDFLKTEQRMSVKLNAAFGFVAAIVTVILFLPSELGEFVHLVQALHGKEIGETPGWALLVAVLSLPIYFLTCVMLTREGEGIRPRRRTRTS